MSANTLEASRIAGAIKGLAALRAMVQATETVVPEETAAQHYDKRLSDALAMVATLGPMAPEQAGAVAVLAEFIHTYFTTGEPNTDPGGWVPLSGMTDAERQAMIDRIQSENDEIDAEIEQARKAARKVVSIADWMGTQ